MSLFFLFYFSNRTRTSTYFSRLTLDNVNNMYRYNRICYCFFCLHINYSNLNYFLRDLSTKKSRVLRTQTLNYSLTIAHRLILVVDPVARASFHRKRSNPAPLSLSHFITIPPHIREYNCRLFPYTETRRRRARCIISLRVIKYILIFITIYIYLYR